jgi:excinuclease UvrABC nuclease subunit
MMNKQWPKTVEENKIRSKSTPDDFTMMHEVVYRLKTFGSLKRIKEASLQELREKGKLPEGIAEQLKDILER